MRKIVASRELDDLGPLAPTLFALDCLTAGLFTETFKFGPNTQKNEHCNLFGFYYPTDDPLEAIDCVHKEDGSEVRILAH